MSILKEAFNVVSKTFRISTLNAQQETGIRKVVEEGKDIFINLSTGSENLYCIILHRVGAFGAHLL